jgi:methyl-accepting chemotaxis protein
MFRQLKIKTWILGIVAVLGVGYLLMLAVVNYSATATHSRMSQISTSLFPSALRMQDAESAFERMKNHYGDAVVLQDQKALGEADKDAASTEAALTAVKQSLSGMDDLNKQADALLTQFSSIRSRDRDTYAAILAAKDGPTEDLMAQVGALGKDNKALSEAMTAFDKVIAGDFQKQLDTVDAYSLRSRITGIVMLGFVVFVCGAAWWVTQSKVVLPLRALAMRLRDIAQGDGDLTHRIEVHGDNEIDEVGVWFNDFIGRIEDIVRRVSVHAETLGAAAIELAHTSQETASQAKQQQEQSARISVTMNEMSTAVNEISQTTQRAAEDARKAEESAVSGGQTVQSTVKAIQELLTANQQTSTRIEELGRSSDAIGKIVSVINEIADQTNLLALNASIEAARAGEHGRGFAVVAGEVRRLAERTSAATKEIDTTVRGIQEGTHIAVEAMRSSMEQVKSGVASANSAGDALTSIISGSVSVQKMVTQIAAAATEQSYSTQSVVSTMGEITASVERTASSSQQSVDASEELSHLANELSGLVGAFKVSDEPSDRTPTQPASGMRPVSAKSPNKWAGAAASAAL